ncbi:nucleotidyltransferase domain-containing protein [Candidatus Bathyarchaeota archaeon]|nr:MAG: nucleotidyltransferase domain-containing protein [Candidatus Bathyarchaeota archaeon]
MKPKMGVYENSVLRVVADARGLIVSVVGFGSYVRGDVSNISDTDLIIVVEDSAPKQEVRLLDEKLNALEFKHQPSRPEGIATRMLFVLARQTGMFVPRFVCERSDFMNLRFHRIFHTNRLLTKLLSPTSIVLGSIFSHARTLHGDNLLVHLRVPRPSMIDWGKSLVMNLLLSVGAAFFSLVTSHAVTFSLEATKWSLYSTSFLAWRDSPRLSVVIKRFVESPVLPRYLNRFMQLRSDPGPDTRFIWFTPIATILIHGSVNQIVRRRLKRNPASDARVNPEVSGPRTV